MASALEQLTNNYETSSPVSFYDYYNAYRQDRSPGYDPNYGKANLYNDDGTLKKRDPYSFAGRLEDWFSGTTKSAQSAYDNYLAEYDYRRKQKENALANSQTWAREDSQIERLMNDYSNSGLNPYLLLSGGNLSSGVVSSQAQRTEFKRRSDEKGVRASEGKALSTALKVLALVILKKAL